MAIRMSGKLGLILIALLASTTCAVAQTQGHLPPQKPFDATYQMLTDPSQNMTTRVICDGQGRTRSESTIQGQQYISLSDMNKKVSYSLNVQQKTAMRVPIENAATYDPQYAKTQSKPIGAKMVEGRPCHGWLMTQGGHQTETWIADDLGCTVLVMADGKPLMRMVRSNPYSANASTFSVPSDYRIVEMPNIPGSATTR
ncbi:MAG TPA: DUF4412 domain-containing protein [Candidatus Obscuribacterales bacterium]